MAGILVLVWINGLMAVLRYRAGPVVKQLSPTGVLLASAALSGVGLLGLSLGGGRLGDLRLRHCLRRGGLLFLATMLGVVSERVPKSGALGLGLMGTVGMATVGLVTFTHDGTDRGPVRPRAASRRGHGGSPGIEHHHVGWG